MGKRSRRKQTGDPAPTATTEYTDPEGNVLTLRNSVSAGTAGKLRKAGGKAAASIDDIWRRRTELLFERFAVRWDIAGLPLEKQDELLGRYRFADQETQRWVRETLDRHITTHQPELQET
jgi:hypothetical protein